MRRDVYIAAAVTLAVILSGLPAPEGAGAAGARTVDADNDFASATSMNPATAYPGTLDSSDDPQDYFFIQANAPGQVFNISVQVSSYPTGTVRLVAYDPAMAMLEQSALGGPWESLSIESVTWNTKYYFAVFLASGTVASYTIQVVLETPKPISWSGSDGGSLARSSDNPADWYVFTLTGGNPNDVAVFTITHDPGVTIDAWLFDLWPGLTTSVCNISLNITSGGSIAFAGTHSDPWYHLKIWASSGSGAYSVRMASQQMMPGDNDYNAANAHRLSNTAQTGYLDSAWDHFAYYKCYLVQGETMRARMNLTQNTPGKFDLFIYHVAGGVYFQDTNTSNFIGGAWTNYVSVTYTATGDGTYYIIPMAEEAHDANGNIASGASNASFTLRIELPDPLNHAPVVVNPPPNPTHIPEDSVNLFMYRCTEIFGYEDMDGESISFTVTGSPNISIRYEKLDTSFYATTTPNWSGQEMIVITATDSSGKTTIYNLYVVVDQVPDAPMLIKPIENQTVVEDQELIMDLTEYFTDADLPYVFGEHLEYRVYSIDPVVPTIRWMTDNESQTLTFGPATNYNHQKEFYNMRKVTLRVTDKGADEVHARTFVFNLNVTLINHRPFANPNETSIYIDEDGVDTSTAIQKYFFDYDIPMGDVLQFKAIRSEHINVTIKPGFLLEVKPEKNWYGEETVYVTATDQSDEAATLNIYVKVNPIPDPPEMDSWSPVPLEWCITETESLNLSVVVTDADTNASELTYTWYLDNNEQLGVTGPSFTFFTDYNSSGLHKIVVIVDDGEVNTTHSWDIPVRNKNQKPEVDITSPLEAGIYLEGQMLRLSAKVNDPEKDTLSYTWKEGNGTLGRTLSLNQKFGPGSHTVTIYVDDGTDTTVKNVTFFSDSIPNATILSPIEGKHYKTTDAINFSAIVFDRDGDTVTVEWRDTYRKVSVLSHDVNFTKKLGKGRHDIILNVTDGRNSFETPYITIHVDEPKNGGGFIPGFELFALLAAILAAAAAVTIFWRGKRRQGHL
jgi:hypothetical protein